MNEQFIIETLKEIKQDQKDLQEASFKHRSETLVWQATTSSRLDSIDENLAEHMRRTDVLEKLHEDNQQRIEDLEQPGKTLATIKKWALWTSGVAGAIVAVAKVLGLF